MRRFLPVGVATAVAAALVTVSPASAAADTTPPLLESFSIDVDDTVEEGDDVTVTYVASDASGIASVRVQFRNPGGPTYEMRGDEAAGTLTWPVNDDDNRGQRELYRVFVTDVAGNYLRVGPGGYYADSTGGSVHADEVPTIPATTFFLDTDVPCFDGTFTDVCTGDTFLDEIEAIAAADITRGCNPPANTRFCRESVVTREQMAAFLTRARGYERQAASFRDVASSNVFARDIGAIAANDVTRG